MEVDALTIVVLVLAAALLALVVGLGIVHQPLAAGPVRSEIGG